MPKARTNPRSILIAETDPKWHLYHQPWRDHGAWRALYLRLHAKRGSVRKRTFWLMWNGSRLARSRDAQILAQHYPDLYTWVEGECARQWALHSLLGLER